MIRAQDYHVVGGLGPRGEVSKNRREPWGGSPRL